MEFKATRKDADQVEMVKTFATLEEAKEWCEHWAVFGFFNFEINGDKIVCRLESWERSTSLFGEPEAKHETLDFGELGCYCRWVDTEL